MSVEIEWINHASFRIASGDTVAYIDPWKLPDAPHDADVVFVSHSHHDHCSPEDVQKVSREDTIVIAPGDTAPKLHPANSIEPGEKVTIKDLTVEAVRAYNVDKQFHPKGNNWCGAIFTIDQKRIYYAGDTDLIEEMSDLKDIDLAMLPIGGTYTLDASQAVEACEVIGCKAAIPYHWGDIVGSLSDAQSFSDSAPCQVHLLQPGQSITI